MSYLTEAKADEAVAVIKQAKTLRQTLRHHRQGYTKDHTMRHIMSFHPSILFHPEFSKYFDKDMDPHERKKNVYRFAKDHPEYVVVDKL